MLHGGVIIGLEKVIKSIAVAIRFDYLVNLCTYE